MKLATTTADFCSYIQNQADILPILKECGFTNVDYNFCHDYFLKTGFYSDAWQTHLEDVKSKAKQSGITFVQSHAPMGRPIIDKEQMLEATLHSIRISHELGIKNIVVHSGYRPGLSKLETFKENREFFMPLLELAEQLCVYVLCENFNKMVIPDLYWIDSAEDLREFLDFVDHPRLHACWDMGHGNMQELPQHEALKILGKDVYAVHVQDNMGDTSDSHLCPYFGTLNLDSVMHGLREINYQGYFTFEVSKLPNFSENRREFKQDTRLFYPSLQLKIAAEKYLYAIGEHILNTSCDW